MSLTLAQAPFSSKQSGVFNFNRKGPDSVLYWEDYPKRVRVVFEDQTIADSRSVKALHETDHFMVYYFPREDVEMQFLESTDYHTECPYKGTASYWSVKINERTAENAAWAYEDPIESAPPIDDYIAFDYGQMDAWFQEDEKIYAHPRNPYHRFDVHASSRQIVIELNGEVVAESNRPHMMFETGLPPRYYLPAEDVRTDWLEKSDTVTQCPYKGDAQHWHLTVNGETVEDAAWSLPDPLGEANRVADHFCFYAGKVHMEADGELVEA